jgi:muramidase (phage lysozyme)
MKNLLFVGLILAGYFLTRKVMDNNVQAAMQDKNVIAFRNMIYKLESNHDYYILYGGSHFSDDSSHPNVHIPFENKERSDWIAGVNNDFSTAAGAGQINHPTWLLIQAVAFLPNFTPASQDEAMVWLFKMRGFLPDIIAGNFSSAVQKASGTWASLPYSTAQQNPAKFQTALNAYVNYGGAQA